jgi:hypothetical protein
MPPQPKDFIIEHGDDCPREEARPELIEYLSELPCISGGLVTIRRLDTAVDLNLYTFEILDDAGTEFNFDPDDFESVADAILDHLYPRATA